MAANNSNKGVETYQAPKRDDNHLLPIKRVPASVISFWCVVALVLLAIGLLIPKDLPASWEDIYLFYKVFMWVPPGFILVYIHTIKQKY